VGMNPTKTYGIVRPRGPGALCYGATAGLAAPCATANPDGHCVDVPGRALTRKPSGPSFIRSDGMPRRLIPGMMPT
jgi:hypothetical protein